MFSSVEAWRLAAVAAALVYGCGPSAGGVSTSTHDWAPAAVISTTSGATPGYGALGGLMGPVYLLQAGAPCGRVGGRNGEDPVTVAWPPGYHTEAEPLTLVGPDIRVPAGKPVWLGGGYVGPVPGCSDTSVWLVSEIGLEDPLLSP